MAITFAGQPLLLEDPGRELQRWLDRALSLDDLRLFGDLFPAKHDARDNSRSGNRVFVGLPTPNWSAPPRPKINTLWWPTGATRWAVGLFLVDKATWDLIYPELLADGGADLVFSDDTSVEAKTFTAKMYALPPRRLDAYSDTAEDSPGGIYLLPLVDVRYFWQFMDVGDLGVDAATTWDDLIGTIETAMEIAITRDTVPEAYLNPDPTELGRRYENVALMLDAIAWSVGQRIVVDLRGSVFSHNSTTTAAIHEYNVTEWTYGNASELGLDPAWQDSGVNTWAGDATSEFEDSRRPESVRVVFPRYSAGCPVGDEVWMIEKGGGLWSGAYKVFHSTCQADMSSGGAEPDNVADLDALAQQIADDYYGHMPPTTWDMSFVGLRKWHPSGYDDWVWWHFGWQYPMPTEGFIDGNRETDGNRERGVYEEGAGGEVGDYACFTRVCSLPYNCHVEEMLHQDGAPECNKNDLVGGCLVTAHPGRGTPFDIYLGEWDPAANGWTYDTGSTVKAIDWRYGVPYPTAGSQGLFTPRDSNEYGTIYECVALDCESPGTCED